MRKRALYWVIGVLVSHISLAAVSLQGTALQPLRFTTVQYQALSTKEQRDIASIWSLSADEYTRYLTVMATTSSGHWYQTLDPAEVLGMNAKSAAERDHYALIVAKMAFERVSQELAFQKSYDAAFKSLYGDIKPIALASAVLSAVQKTPWLQRGDKIFVFTALSSELPSHVISRLVSAIQTTPNTQLDFFITDTTVSDEAIRTWAAKHQLPIDLVKAKRVTLNRDNGFSSRFFKTSFSLPLVARERKGTLTPIALGDSL